MAILSAMINALSCFHPELMELEDEDRFRMAAARLISKIRTIAAYAYRHSGGQPYIYPDPRLRYVPNFLHMLFSQPYAHYDCDERIARALNLVLILHADHEQNCSTSTVRLVGSSHAHLYASIAAGISALWGPLHGGANQKVVEMLEQIAAQEGSAVPFLAKAKDRNDTTRLMGFGHRVYKSYDPRAKILKAACKKVVERVGGSSRLLEIAMQLEEITLSDDYFVSRRLYPNVDFYSGVIYKAIGIPVNMFTVMFALGRLPGWIAQWIEMRQDPSFRIGRPRQVYTGATARSL
jgi:citrate synthase